MELVESLFNELRRKLNDDINHLEKQVMYIVEKEGASAATQGNTQYQSFEFLKPIDIQLEKLNQQLYRMEIENQAMKQRLEALEEMPAPNVIGSKTPTMRAGGLEDLFIRTLVSPDHSSVSEENSIIMPVIQRQVVLEEAEPDEEAIKGEVADEVGGVDEEAEEEEDTEGAEAEDAEEEEAEEEEEETLTLEEFTYKGKNYYKTPSPDNKVYRVSTDGEVEDEPFAEYDEKNNRLVRISTQ
jgi:hypothetical protein